MEVYERARVQMSLDAAMMAANELYHMGPKRAEAFRDTFCKYYDEVAVMLLDNDKGDKESDYAKGVVDRKIKQIVGEELFVPWEERYSK